MKDYNGLARAVREELESRTNKDSFEKEETKNKKEPQQKSDNFWVKLRENILLLVNKAPK